MPNHAAHALLTIGAVLAALSSIHGASYTFTTIDVPDALSVSAFGINDRGQIVGSYLDASFRNHGFLWNEGVFSTIDFPGAITTVATGINARGQIVGTYDFFAPRTTAGFLWDQGVFTTIDVPGAFDTHLGGINARAKSWASTATAPGWRMAFCGRRVCLRRSMSPMPARPCPGGSTDSARSQATTSMPVSGSTVFSWTRGYSPRSTSRVPPSVSRPNQRPPSSCGRVRYPAWFSMGRRSVHHDRFPECFKYQCQRNQQPRRDRGVVPFSGQNSWLRGAIDRREAADCYCFYDSHRGVAAQRQTGDGRGVGDDRRRLRGGGGESRQRGV